MLFRTHQARNSMAKLTNYVGALQIDITSTRSLHAYLIACSLVKTALQWTKLWEYRRCTKLENLGALYNSCASSYRRTGYHYYNAVHLDWETLYGSDNTYFGLYICT